VIREHFYKKWVHSHMQNEIIFLVTDSPEGGFEARALGEGIFTEADSLDELKGNIKEAVLAHFDEGQNPANVRLHFVKEELIKI